MTISSISSNNYYTGQMSASWGRSTGMYGGEEQGAPAAGHPDPVEIFSKLDQDNSGGLDQSEFQSLADKIAEARGEEVDTEGLFATYDADGDGVLNEEETTAAMEANRPEGPPPPPQGGMMGGAPPDISQMFSDTDTDGSGGLNQSEFQTLADKIAEATGEEVDAEGLFATYDADSDGVLSAEETQTAMEANRPKGPPPPPPGGMMGESENSLSASSAGIESYFKIAALEQSSNMSANYSGNDNAYLLGTLYSVNIQA